jgi:hypothetical protein
LTIRPQLCRAGCSVSMVVFGAADHVKPSSFLAIVSGAHRVESGRTVAR